MCSIIILIPVMVPISHLRERSIHSRSAIPGEPVQSRLTGSPQATVGPWSHDRGRPNIQLLEPLMILILSGLGVVILPLRWRTRTTTLISPHLSQRQHRRCDARQRNRRRRRPSPRTRFRATATTIPLPRLILLFDLRMFSPRPRTPITGEERGGAIIGGRPAVRVLRVLIRVVTTAT